jgi:hypothetical protein
MNDLLRPRIWPSFLASSGVGPCDVPLRYASDQSRGTAGRLPGGTPIFVVSRQQCIKYPGSLIGSQKSLGLHGNLVGIESGQVLLPEKQLAS